MDNDIAQAGRTRTFGGLRYCQERNTVIDRDDQPIPLRPKTLEVFRLLSTNHNSVVSRESLLESVWADVHVTEDSLTQCIAELRKALGPDVRGSLKTIPKRGYLLVPDPIPEADLLERAAPRLIELRNRKLLSGVMLVLFALFGILSLYTVFDTGEIKNKANAGALASINSRNGVDITQSVIRRDDAIIKGFAPTTLLRVSTSSKNPWIDPDLLRDELSLSLSRYKTIQLVDQTDSNYTLQVLIRDTETGKSYVILSLVDNQTSIEVFTERIDALSINVDPARMAARISALVASPATGSIGRELLAKGRRKPVEELTRAECYAHSYDCTNCSGELDSIDTRAQTCLTNILAKDDNDVRAWGLQSTTYAKQYQWSTNLGEPLRTNVKLRQEIAQKALAAANRAEQLSDGTDSSVYWGMAQAYMAACDVPKMRTAINRGLQINPDDPGLLATFGNWLAYSGNWEEGTAMVEKALVLEPKHYKNWWLFAIAKQHYIKGEYQLALDVFERAFNERNWLSHLQLAYTLPYLDRIDEAKAAAEKLQFVFPGVTIEVALQLYKLYCFPDEYLVQMKKGLQLAGLPERGNSSDIANIEMPMSRIAKLENWDVEYMDLGQGTPVVFVHGAMADYRSWAHYQNSVSEKYRYISYSRRYYGSQIWNDEGQLDTVAQHAIDLENFIEHLALGPVLLVTWSSGSSVSTKFALNRPDLVTGIVLYEPNTLQIDDPEDPKYPHAEKKRFLSAFKRVFEHLKAGRIEQTTKAFAETVFEKKPGEFETELMWIRRVMLDNMRSVPLFLSEKKEPDIEIHCDDLAALKTPTLVMVGELTHALWQYRARRFVHCAPNASLQSIAGVNHAGPIRVPAEIFSRLDEFMESL